MIITIDGPSASGKSTIARQLARNNNYFYIYSGLLYRALGYVLGTQKGYTAAAMIQAQEHDIDAVLQDLAYLYDPLSGESVQYQNVVLSQDALMARAADEYASYVSSNPYARSALTAYQRKLAHHKRCVIDGRDSGSVVFPDTIYKFYLTATPEVRARRLIKRQLTAILTYQEALAAITVRDERDMKRLCDPLCIPAGALVIDTSRLSIAEVVTLLERYIK